MADKEQIKILKQGVPAWNAWCEANPTIRNDLFEANLSKANLSKANLRGANLRGADLSEANLRWADLTRADLSVWLDPQHRPWRTSGYGLRERPYGPRKRPTTKSGYKMSKANLSGADLRRANLTGANLREALLSGANLREALLLGTNLQQANLQQANLVKANLSEANLTGANLQEAHLVKAHLTGADLTGADLREAKLSGADLTGADLSGADLTGADLTGARLQRAIFVETDFTNADLTDCHIYGMSAWDLKLEGAKQNNLIVTKRYQSKITVDKIEIAQFIYLLLKNEKIRDVIDTVGKKGVLILGRFTPERKAVLNAMRGELRRLDYLPILFDFDKPASKDLTGTVSTLAHMARFIIADLTDPSSVPHELAMVIPTTVVPVKPILLSGKGEYAMLDDLRRRHHWLLPTHSYASLEQLVVDLREQVILPAEAKALELQGAGTKPR